ncbi:hypothetical protein G3O08_06825 [Cryomorpha ignava]|uniref:Carboxypeptidase regulatory-like domain-containing protein n=1 Tax=Cryomorpha ignava TaxID=101383 RepID=A0A7K3WQB2_9FLAO|nr:hypothetical protein [Cryomorpha ignava]NEN23211.1 hypothetical protein [Cryomorpha ignava]
MNRMILVVTLLEKRISKLLSRIVMITLLSCGLMSCWFPCAPAVNGHVKEDLTGEPLDSVKIEFFEEGILIQTIYTDTTGSFSFDMESESVFFTRKCGREFTLIFEKPAFDQQEFNDEAPKVGIQINLK